MKKRRDKQEIELEKCRKEIMRTFGKASLCYMTPHRLSIIVEHTFNRAFSLGSDFGAKAATRAGKKGRRG